MIESALNTHLLGRPGLTALVGDRIYPMILPQGTTLPAVTYQRISGPRERPYKMATPRFQVSCWAMAYKQAKLVADQVRLALDGFSGNLGGTIHAYARVLNDADMYDESTGIYHIAVDVEIGYEE